MEDQREPSEDQEPPRLEPGMKFDDFVLIEPIGKGGMGTIWRARETALRRDVALKFLRPSRLSSAAALERFHREAQALARTNHPGIVTVYSVGNAHGQPYIAQELIEGGRTLGDLITRARDGSDRTKEYFRKVAELVAQVADALQAAHDSGILHRDVKPNNLLLTPAERIKVVDFGLARLLDAASVTDSGVAVGTIPYTSPEQVLGKRDVDGRTDVFGLGATLYELLTFRRAFEGDSPNAIAHRVLTSDPEDPRALDSRVPGDLAVLCNKALEKRPEDRFASMRELHDELRRFLADEPLRTHSPSTMQRARKWVRRHPGASATMAVAALGLCAVTWLGAVNAAARREKRLAQRAELHASAQYAIEMGDLTRARALIAQAGELVPDDYTGHLILASGFAKYARLAESQREIEAARAQGFSSDPRSLKTALEHGAYALYLKSKLDFGLYPEAEAHILEALRLDHSLYPLQFALYQMRVAVGDVAGARQALGELRGELKPADPFSAVIHALDQELGDDPRGALVTLEDLAAREELDEARLAELSWHRNMGRLCVRIGDLERGETFLKRAVADSHDDCWSWNALAALHVQRYMEEGQALAELDAADDAATRAHACSASLIESLKVRAFVASRRLELAKTPLDPDASQEWRAAREALDALRSASDGTAPELPDLEANLVLLEARGPFEKKDFGHAADLLRAAVDEPEVGIQAAALLGQCCWYLKRYEEGLDVLEAALERWDDPSWKGTREERWLGALLAWILGHAGKLSDGAAMDSAKERLVLELEQGKRFQPEELLTAAEFLSAEAPVGLRDCELARSLVVDHELERALEGRGQFEEARKILARIDEACE